MNNLPRVIHVVSEERKTNYTWDSTSEYMDKNIKVLTENDLKSDEYKGIKWPSFVSEGDVLILHPCECNAYINVSDIAKHRNDTFFKYKDIAGLLGAKMYKITRAEKITCERSIDAKANFGIKDKVKTHPSVEDEEKFKETCGFELTAKWPGQCRISDETYQEALTKQKKYRLEDDEQIKTLIEGRNPRRANLDQHLSVTYETSNEINKNLDIALTIDCCKAFNINATIKQNLKHREDLKLTIEFEFPTE